jgi:hypothetical protein
MPGAQSVQQKAPTSGVRVLAAHWPWDCLQKPRVPLLKRALVRTEKACKGAWGVRTSVAGWIWKPGAGVGAINP